MGLIGEITVRKKEVDKVVIEVVAVEEGEVVEVEVGIETSLETVIEIGIEAEAVREEVIEVVIEAVIDLLILDQNS